MLLGIPGDNTFSNYAEANRTFWRNTVIPLATRSARSLGDWLSPAYTATKLTLKLDLDAVEALSPEREALWARLDKSTFLTDAEKRQAAGYDPIPPPKYDPGQPRVPGGSPNSGQWTKPGAGGGDGGSPDPFATPDGSPAAGTGFDGNEVTLTISPTDAQPEADTTPASNASPQADVSEWPTWDNPDLVEVQARQPTRSVRVFGRNYNATPSQETDLIFSASRAEAAARRVRELDPAWKATPTVSSQTADGAIAYYRGFAQEAEARIQVIERGNLPLGFNSQAEFREFGRIALNGFRQAGYADAQPYLRGSAVTGNSYLAGSPFDTNRRSDYDLAVVSPTLMQRARDIGVRTLGGGTRTGPLSEDQLRSLGIFNMTEELGSVTGRSTSWVIYNSYDAMRARGPLVPIP